MRQEHLSKLMLPSLLRASGPWLRLHGCTLSYHWFLGRVLRLAWFIEKPPALGWAGGDTTAVPWRMAGPWFEGWGWVDTGCIGRRFRSFLRVPRCSSWHTEPELCKYWCETELCTGGAELGRCWVRQDLVCWSWVVAGDIEAPLWWN